MNNKLKDKLLTITFILFISSILIVNILKKDNSVSLTERRKLETLPKLTYSSYISSSFMDKFDKYTTDQFIFRDKFRKLKINLELNIKDNYNNLYKYNDYIIKEIYPINENSINNITNKINYIKNTYLNNTNNIYYSIIPDKNYYISDGNVKIDYNKLISIMNNNLKDINYIDITNKLNITDYYKTDTHWKQENLIELSDYIKKSMNKNKTSSYLIKEVSTFNGVYSEIDNSITDKIYLLSNNVIDSAEVYNYETKMSSNIYNLNKLNSLDKYDVYLGGSNSLLKVTNNLANTNSELIIFRDSYTSSLTPLLIDAYKSIYLIDTRYISPKLLNNYINFNNKDVLFIYSTLVINDSSSLK